MSENLELRESKSSGKACKMKRSNELISQVRLSHAATISCFEGILLLHICLRQLYLLDLFIPFVRI